MSDSEAAIITKNLTRKFGNFTAVDKLDLNISKASIYGFLGPNGCGKTTTIRMLCGLLAPTSGEVKVLGLNLPGDAEKLRIRSGYMTQKFSLYEDLTVLENLEFMGRIYRLSGKVLKQRINTLLGIYSLEKFQKQRAGSMSGGQRQRLALATATLHEPDLLFLDEPTSAVDPENRRDFWEKLFDLCEQGTSILVSTHYMDEAERCHQLAILEDGQLRAQGQPTSLMNNLGANVIELECKKQRKVKQELLKLDAVKSVSQQGLRLRILIDNSVSEPCEYIRSKLDGVEHNSFSVNPSLEDVFVSVTKGEKQNA